jgi:DNA-directed RNA polymerase specialized sigma24 family protein
MTGGRAYQSTLFGFDARLNDMSRPEREAFERCHAGPEDPSDVALDWGVSASSVRTQLMRARRKAGVKAPTDRRAS